MNTLMYTLHLVGWQESQVTEYVQALTEPVNTASLNLTAVQVGSEVCILKYLMNFKINPSWVIPSAYIKVRIHI